MTKKTWDELLAEETKPIKGKRSRQVNEDKMLKRCITWFDERWRRLSWLLHHSPNENQFAHLRSRNASLGTRSGFPDLIWLAPIKSDKGMVPYVGIEFKYGHNKQEDVQKEYESSFRSVGAEYYVIYKELKFKELIVILLEKAILYGSITLNKFEEQMLEDAHKEIHELIELEQKENQLKLKKHVRRVYQVKPEDAGMGMVR